MTLGFIGAGTIASAIVTGLHASSEAPPPIVLSPRNAAVASNLAARFPGVLVAASNQDVLDQCDTVVLSIRPQGAESILQQMCFKKSHQVISVVAAFGLEKLRSLLAPARQITRAIPLPSAAQRQSPTVLYPANEAALQLFRLVGPAFPVGSEEQFNALSAATAVVASYFAFADTVTSWLVQRGVPAMPAKDYVSRILPSLQEEVTHMPDLGLRSMAAAHATAGGLNEQVLKYLEANAVFSTMTEALDRVMRRVSTTASGTAD